MSLECTVRSSIKDSKYLYIYYNRLKSTNAKQKERESSENSSAILFHGNWESNCASKAMKQRGLNEDKCILFIWSCNPVVGSSVAEKSCIVLY